MFLNFFVFLLNFFLSLYNIEEKYLLYLLGFLCWIKNFREKTVFISKCFFLSKNYLYQIHPQTSEHKKNSQLFICFAI